MLNHTDTGGDLSRTNHPTCMHITRCRFKTILECPLKAKHPVDHAIGSSCSRTYKQSSTTNIHGERNTCRLTNTHYRIHIHLNAKTSSPVSGRRLHSYVNILPAVVAATELARYKYKVLGEARGKKTRTSARRVRIPSLAVFTRILPLPGPKIDAGMGQRLRFSQESS